MSNPEREHDMRQLDRDRERRKSTPGEMRPLHLEGTPEIYILTRWHVHPGEAVEVRQTIATAETASLVIEIEAYDRGIMCEHCIVEGQEVPDGAIVARITPYPLAEE
jgi:hypothetical protein